LDRTDSAMRHPRGRRKNCERRGEAVHPAALVVEGDQRLVACTELAERGDEVAELRRAADVTAEEDDAPGRMLGQDAARVRVQPGAGDADHEQAGDRAAEQARRHRRAYSNPGQTALTRRVSCGLAATPMVAGASRQVRGWVRTEGWGGTSRARDPSESAKRPSRDGSPPNSAPT